MIEYIAILLFISICGCLLIGFPVAFTLAGVSLIFAGIGISIGVFDPALLYAIPPRLFGIMNNNTLVAVPLFILMGVLLERSKIAEQLLSNMAALMHRIPAGLGISVVLVGALLAASTGIVGATVVTMGLISLPTMLAHNYKPELACGTICATGTLGQIIPPSIALILLGDTMSNAYQKAQLESGVLNPQTISVGDLFMGAVFPGLLLVVSYILYLWLKARRQPLTVSANTTQHTTSVSYRTLIVNLSIPLALMLTVLGSIIFGVATITSAAAIGALGAFLLAIFRARMKAAELLECAMSTLKINAMIFMILIGATIFSLIFRGFNGDEIVQGFFHALPGDKYIALLTVMLLMFLLGFILDFIEIIFVVVPIVVPILLQMGFDPLWLGILIAVNLQTSFLTPPFGFALFYLRSVVPESITTAQIYSGVKPFILIQLAVLFLLVIFPDIITYLPRLLN